MSSSASNIESLTPTSRGSPVFSLIITHKWKLVLSVALLLGAVAAIGVCAAAVSVTSTGAGRETTDSTRSVHSQEINGEASENEHIRNRRLPTVAEAVEFRPSTSCYSDALNDTLPAAHIRGKGFEWEVNRNGDAYKQLWDCNTSLAYVSGGMWFKQEDKSLYVPKCGWYSVSSNIAFQNNGRNNTSYSYGLKIDRNCNSDRNNYHRAGHTVNAPIRGMLESITSIQINDIVKICQGGRIYVIIPTEMNACCPRGYSETTSLTAHLVREDDCQWPVRSHKHPREDYQHQS